MKTIRIEKYLKLFRMTEGQILNYMSTQLDKNKSIQTPDYLYYQGSLPVLLVAHADTVFTDFSRKNMDIFHDPKKQVLWSPDGLGADDRAGVISVLEILRRGYDPHVLITTGEEIGGVGVNAFVDDMINFNKLDLLDNIKFMLEVDREGHREAVYYVCDGLNDKFEYYIGSFGFKHGFGTYSDVHTLMSETLICGANLSAGYYSNHTKSERLYYGQLAWTIDKVDQILGATPDEDFRFRRQYYKSYPQDRDSREGDRFDEYSNSSLVGYDYDKCPHCGGYLYTESEYEVCPTCDANLTDFFCFECTGDITDTESREYGMCTACYQDMIGNYAKAEDYKPTGATKQVTLKVD